MIDIVRLKGALARKAQGTLWPAEAALDRALLRASFIRVLEENLREAASNRYDRDGDFHKTAQRDNKNGDFPNERAADGITGSSVEDVVQALHEAGFHVEFEDVYSMLSQYLCTGLITDVVVASAADGSKVAIPISIDAANPPVIKEGCVDGYRVLERGPGMWLVTPSGDSTFSSIHLAIALPTVRHCSCGRSTCKQLSAVLKHLASTVPVSGRPCAFERTAKSERLNRALRLAGSFGIFAPLPKHVRKGHPEIPLPARAFSLILEQILGQEYDDEASVNVRALLQAGVYKTRLPHINTRRRYSQDASVLRLLTLMRAAAARPLVERHLLRDNAFSSETRDAKDLSADIVSCLDIRTKTQLLSANAGTANDAA